jgi:hypothetical protein
MKNTILALILATLNYCALAQEWVKFGENSVGVQYIDPATIKRDWSLRRWSLRRVWQVFNWGERLDNGEMSQRFLVEYDCREEQYRYLAWDAMTEAMGKGEPIGSSPNRSEAWSHIAPGTIHSAILIFVCSQ